MPSAHYSLNDAQSTYHQPFPDEIQACIFCAACCLSSFMRYDKFTMSGSIASAIQAITMAVDIHKSHSLTNNDHEAGKMGHCVDILPLVQCWVYRTVWQYSLKRLTATLFSITLLVLLSIETDFYLAKKTLPCCYLSDLMVPHRQQLLKCYLTLLRCQVV